MLEQSDCVIEGQAAGRKFRAIALPCAALTLTLGLITLIGWISGLSLLASVRAKYIPMAPSSALCFSLLGIGLIVRLGQASLRWLPRLFAIAVLMIAVAKLVEFAAGFHFGIDTWLVRNPEMFGRVPTGRMAPLTALTFVLTAVGLYSLTGRESEKWAGAFGALATSISAVVLVGYWYGTPLLYGGTVIPVAFLTACAFALCGVAIVSVAGAEGWPLRLFLGDTSRALLLRSFVPVIIAAAFINGWVNAALPQHIRANPAVISALCAIAFAVLITWIISHVSLIVGGRIDRAEEARNLAQAELLALNAQLETRIQDRTRQLAEKNQQMEEELKMARELQVALLPQQFPTVPANVAVQESALRFLSLYFPTGDVSGDFFSVFPVGENAAGVFICDVMGHGVRSALITSMIRALVEENAQVTSDPGELLTRVNRALAFILKQAGTTMFATCFYAVADVERAQLRFANAGHPSALHVRSGDATTSKLQGNGRPGPAIGIFPAATYTTSSKSIAKGDLVMLFTDGLFEVEDAAGRAFSEEQLQATVSRHSTLPPSQFFTRVLDDIREFSQREYFEDDVCVVGIQVQHTGEDGVSNGSKVLANSLSSQ
ncbi:MAG: phosphoserine phosphatase RsbU/P [Verrucomicrobiota bacterium]|jgi:serine phosphatase RsbU (regulator of sigma subunit)